MNTFGLTSQGLPIYSYEFGTKGPQILILAGVHGDEPEGIYVAKGLLHSFLECFEYQLKLTLIPIFNIEGALNGKRTNGNNVDLNRNLPTKNWTDKYERKKYHPGLSPCSEPENKALTKWIKIYKPKLVISLHSWHPMINTNGDCNLEAEIISQHTKYKISDYIGYPTPGSLGDYCGMERDIPTITYEIAKGSSVKESLELHVPAIKKALFASEKRT